MIVIAAIDDQGGMMFNRRRQSQDSVLRERILDLAKDSRLWMNAYTRRQFTENSVQSGSRAETTNGNQTESARGAEILVDEEFLEKAGSGEYCFVENLPLSPCENRIEKVLLFRWNRAYPGDFFFDLDLSLWKLSGTEEFAGSSHEKITEEAYVHA